jgi:hypothetical protein
VSTAAALASSPFAPLLAEMVKYYIVPAGYDTAALLKRDSDDHLRTLWDPAEDAAGCGASEADSSNGTGDGDIKVGIRMCVCTQCFDACTVKT